MTSYHGVRDVIDIDVLTIKKANKNGVSIFKKEIW